MTKGKLAYIIRELSKNEGADTCVCPRSETGVRRNTYYMKIKSSGGSAMSTYMPKAGDITRKWYVIDAADKPLGRVAAAAAHVLRGKHKVTYAPHADCGDHVIIINAEKAVLTGRKLEKKYYRYHTGWFGGLKEVQYKHLMAGNPEKAMMLAIKGMLPNTTVGRTQLTRVRIYRGPEHVHAAQKPEALEM